MKKQTRKKWIEECGCDGGIPSARCYTILSSTPTWAQSRVNPRRLLHNIRRRLLDCSSDSNSSRLSTTILYTQPWPHEPGMSAAPLIQSFGNETWYIKTTMIEQNERNGTCPSSSDCFCYSLTFQKTQETKNRVKLFFFFLLLLFLRGCCTLDLMPCRGSLSSAGHGWERWLWIYIQFAGSFRNLGVRPTFRDGLKGHENKNGKKKPQHTLAHGNNCRNIQNYRINYGGGVIYKERMRLGEWHEISQRHPSWFPCIL